MNCILGETISPDCFQAILQAMAEAVLIIDLNCQVVFCNQAMEELMELPADQIIGRHCRDLLVCKCSEHTECTLLKEGELRNVECRLTSKRGTERAIIKNGRRIQTPDGTVIGVVETLTDITALKHSQARIAELELSVQSEKRFGQLIGHSRPMHEVFELIALAAASNASVLITGETGTGKEKVAQAIHEHSMRSAAPLVKVNCSALNENLLESELFGHARGAFTGAVADKIGRFERAEGGTLFLDEIGDISPLIQVKLLRFLQEREFERVGESITRKADVRIITATNADLRQKIQEGKFREDLYYRLKVFPVHLPPLRERKEDIGPLVNYFIEKFNRETKKTLTGLTRSAAVLLMDYCWPGNIRELENAIEHAFVTCQEGAIDVIDLPLEIRRDEMRHGLCVPVKHGDQLLPDYAAVGRGSVPSNAELTSLIERVGGNRSRAARQLGVDRTTLWRWLKRAGIE